MGEEYCMSRSKENGASVEDGRKGDEENVKETPLRLSFHKHYYAMGEHYNSVVPC